MSKEINLNAHLEDLTKLYNVICSNYPDCDSCPMHTDKTVEDSNCLANQYRYVMKIISTALDEVSAENKDVKELTVDEISKLLGYKVKIIGEDK